MNRLLSLMLSNSVFANMVMLLIFAGGAAGLMTMQREGFPNIPLDLVTVSVAYPGAGPEEVEEGICKKLEESLQGISGVKRLQIEAMEGRGTALVECEAGADADKVKTDVSQMIDTISTFPEDTEKPVVQLVEIRSEVLNISVWGDISSRSLREVAYDLKDRISKINDVSRVQVMGIRDYEISIEVKESALRKYRMSFDEVVTAIRRGSLNLPGGTIKTDKESINIRTLGRAYRGEEFEKIVVRATPGGERLTLRDLADVRDTFEEIGAIGRFNGTRGATLIVEKGEYGDSIVIAGKVKELVDKVRLKLPDEVQLTIWQNLSEMIEGRIDLLRRNGLAGLLLVLLVLWLFMDIRLSFWVGMGIPISLAGGVAIIALFGYSINMINLFGMIMVLGIIVDDAIVVGEAIYVQRRKGHSSMDAVMRGTREVFWPVFAAVSTTIVAFIPLFFVSGVMGKFISILPPIVVAALVVSLIESLYILPVHLRHLKDLEATPPSNEGSSTPMKNKSIRQKLDAWIEGDLQTHYRRLIEWCLLNRYTTFSVMLMFALVTVGLIQGRYVKFITFPDIDSDYIVASVRYPDGTSVHATEEALKKVESAWQELDQEIKSQTDKSITRALYSSAGSIKTQIIEKGNHLGQIILQLMPAEERQIYYKDLLDRWREKVGKLPGTDQIKFESIEHGPGGQDIEVWLLSNHEATRKAATLELKNALAGINGVTEIESSDRRGKRELRVTMKPAASFYGVSLADIAEQTQTAFFGKEAMRIQRGRDEIKVKIRYSRSERKSLQTLEYMRIRTPTGVEVPLKSVAEFHMEPGYAKIERYLGQRKTAVTASVVSKIVTSQEVNDTLKKNVFPDLELKYPDLQIIVEGQAKQTRESNMSMMYGLLLSLLVIFLIIATTFKSYAQPLVVMFIIPFGMVGAVWGHVIMGISLSMFSLFGIVALTGVVVNDSIIMVQCINDNLRERSSLFEALCLSGIRRLRPILLTTFTTAAGLFPILLEKSMQAQFLIPMAVSIVFGVIFATVLTLILVPCFYLILNDLRRIGHWYLTKIWPKQEQVEPICQST